MAKLLTMVCNLKWLRQQPSLFLSMEDFPTDLQVCVVELLDDHLAGELRISGPLPLQPFQQVFGRTLQHHPDSQNPAEMKDVTAVSFKFSAKFFKHILALGTSAKTLIRLNHRGRFSRAESTISRKLGNLALRVLCKKNTNTSGFESMPTGKKKVAFKMLTLASFSYALAS